MTLCQGLASARYFTFDILKFLSQGHVTDRGGGEEDWLTNGDRDQPELRERIREAAYELFGRHGYHGTTTRMLANELGVSVPALYYHYRNKQELLVGVMKQDLIEVIEVIQKTVRGHEAPLEALDVALRHHIRRRMTLADYGRGRIHRTEMRFVEPEYREELLTLRDTYEQIFRGILAQCVAEGLVNVPDLRMATRAMLQMTSAITDWYQPGGPLTPDEIEQTYLGLIWAMLQVPREQVEQLTPSKRNRRRSAPRS